MIHKFKKEFDNFSIEIKADISNDVSKSLVNSVGNLAVSNLCLIDTSLQNTCLNLLSEYSEKVLEILADFTEINQINFNDNEIQKILDEHSSINNFKL